MAPPNEVRGGIRSITRLRNSPPGYLRSASASAKDWSIPLRRDILSRHANVNYGFGALPSHWKGWQQGSQAMPVRFRDTFGNPGSEIIQTKTRTIKGVDTPVHGHSVHRWSAARPWKVSVNTANAQIQNDQGFYLIRMAGTAVHHQGF